MAEELGFSILKIENWFKIKRRELASEGLINFPVIFYLFSKYKLFFQSKKLNFLMNKKKLWWNTLRKMIGQVQMNCNKCFIIN